MKREKYFEHAKSILDKRNIYVDCRKKEEALKDAVAESIALYIEMDKSIENSNKKKQWICNTAVNKFMHLYKFYERFDFYEPIDFAERFADCTPIFECKCREAEFRDWLTEYCYEDEIELLVNIYCHKFKYKEIAEIMDISEDAVKQRKKRILARLKKIISPPLNN